MPNQGSYLMFLASLKTQVNPVDYLPSESSSASNQTLTELSPPPRTNIRKTPEETSF